MTLYANGLRARHHISAKNTFCTRLSSWWLLSKRSAKPHDVLGTPRKQKQNALGKALAAPLGARTPAFSRFLGLQRAEVGQRLLSRQLYGAVR